MSDHMATDHDLRSLRALTGGPRRHDPRELLGHVHGLVSIALAVLKVDEVGLVLLDEDDRPHVVAATGGRALVLHDGQELSETGPGVDCLRTGETVAESDLQGSRRYPRLKEPLTGTSVRAVLSSPVRVDRAVVGSLNAFGRGEHPWTPQEVRANDAYALVIGRTLRLVAHAAEADDSVRRLQDQVDLSGGLEDDPEA